MTAFADQFYIVALTATGMMSITIANSAWWRRKAPGSRDFAFMMLGVSIWSLGYALHLAVPDFEAKKFWNQILFFGITVLPVLWMTFSLSYTGLIPKLSRTIKLMLFIMPLATNVVIWTNDAHHLFWANTRAETIGSISTLISTRETWFWIHTAYSYVCLMIGTFALLRLAFSRETKLYRGQAIALLLGVLAPWIGNALYIFGLFPVPLLDPTPFAFTITGLTLSLGILRYGLFDILPAARDAVLDSMAAGVIVLDAQNKVVELNPAAQVFFKRSHPHLTTLVGQDAFAILSPWPALVERFQDTSFAIVSDVPMKMGDTITYVDVRISPLRDSNGKMTGRVVVASDVTDRKSAADLEKAKQTAEASSQAKSAFLASMSHELRTPLNHIIGYGEMLIEEVQTNKHVDLYEADLKKIHAAGKHLLALITSILEISKLEAGMVKPQPETFSLIAFLEEIASHARMDVEKNGNRFLCQFPKEDVTLQTDPAKLRQALINLMNNAGKFTSNGQVELIAAAGEDPDHLTLSVRDTGIGIAPARIQNLFEAFAIPDTTKRNRAENLGLGLATARHLCKLLGGDISVESAAGRGSTFHITIPKILDASAEDIKR